MPKQLPVGPYEAALPVRPTMIGIYGLPGCGKSTLKRFLASVMDTKKVEFHEGTDLILDVFDGDLKDFKMLPEPMKEYWREQAVHEQTKKCAAKSNMGVVTGHYSFWNEEDGPFEAVWTDGDAKSYTHIIYLNVDPSLIYDQRAYDTTRSRPTLSIEHLHKWQEREKAELRNLCAANSILFTVVRNSAEETKSLLNELLGDFSLQSEEYNTACVMQKVDQEMGSMAKKPQTVLILDADKTLTPLDTGFLFWEKEKMVTQSLGQNPLEMVFSDQNDPYSYHNFRQAQLLYSEVTDDSRFKGLCSEVAGIVKPKLYKEFVDLLMLVEKSDNMGAVIVTSGLARVWQYLVKMLALSKDVKVIGCGRICEEDLSDRIVVTPEVKAAVVTRLQQEHKAYVWAFGDSPIDIPMLHQADRAVVVVGEEGSRSKSMDQALEQAINEHGLVAEQVLLPSDVKPRLCSNELEETSIKNIIDFELGEDLKGYVAEWRASSHAAKLLARDTRDSRIAGPALRAAHHRMGWYVATEVVAKMIGLEKIQIPHVQGNTTTAYRLLHEKRTVIVPLMRGGEPMAMGVSEAFPLASFVHAKEATDITAKHIEGRSTIILVDGVVNTGRSLLPFIHHIRKFHRSIRIVVVAGVVQEDAIAEGGVLESGLKGHGTLWLAALRVSKNKFKGLGGTDTGHRLFNTTDLDD